MNEVKKWKPLSREVVFAYVRFDLVKYSFELPDNRVVDDYYVLEENDVGSVVAITPENELVLVKQYKHGIQQICIELPAGLFEDDKEDPIAESRREFTEETGYDAEKYIYLGGLPQNPTRLNNQVHIVLAINAFKKTSQHLDTTEDIDILLLPVNEVLDKIRSGEINAVGTVAGILMSLDFLRNNPDFHSLPIEEW
jgi:8-oxo-dGTP pyrophosphatase MutT (NUDIX family)